MSNRNLLIISNIKEIKDYWAQRYLSEINKTGFIDLFFFQLKGEIYRSIKIRDLIYTKVPSILCEIKEIHNFRNYDILLEKDWDIKIIYEGGMLCDRFMDIMEKNNCRVIGYKKFMSLSQWNFFSKSTVSKKIKKVLSRFELMDI